MGCSPPARELLTLSGHNGEVTGVAFSPDGRAWPQPARTRAVQLYALNIQDLMTLARTRVSRSLTSKECQKYLHQEQCPPHAIMSLAQIVMSSTECIEALRAILGPVRRQARDLV